MLERTHQVVRFVHAVRRRMVMLRLVESAGVGALLGCAVGLVFSLVLLWRGEGAIGAAASCVGGGLVLGFIWGVSRRPTVVQAAMEADRQLGWQDLLLTAVSVMGGENEANRGAGLVANGRLSPSPSPSLGGRGVTGGQNEATGRGASAGDGESSPSPGPSLGGRGVTGGQNEATDPFARAVVGMAAERCSAHSPSELVMHRLGARAWGGIGLSAAFVFAVAGLATQAEQGRAEVGRQAFVDPRALGEVEMRQNEATGRGNVSQQAEHAGGRDVRQRDSDRVLLPEAADETEEARRVESGLPDGVSPSGADGAGSGVAQTDGDPETSHPFHLEGSQGRQTGAEGQVRTGSGRPEEGVGEQAGAGSSGWTMGPDRSRSDVSEGSIDRPSAADREAASDAIREGRVPDAYRNLVRDYFAPTQ